MDDGSFVCFSLVVHSSFASGRLHKPRPCVDSSSSLKKVLDTPVSHDTRVSLKTEYDKTGRGHYPYVLQMKNRFGGCKCSNVLHWSVRLLHSSFALEANLVKAVG